MTTKTLPPLRSEELFAIEREFAVSPEALWALWTTAEGIESWWGPDGFQVKVESIDVRAGGELVYVMTAAEPEQVAFMEKAGMPLATQTRLTFTEVSRPHRLAYTMLADFVPEVAPYDVATVVEMKATPKGVKLIVTSGAMHDDLWTERARAGHESQMRKLDVLLAESR